MTRQVCRGRQPSGQRGLAVRGDPLACQQQPHVAALTNKGTASYMIPPLALGDPVADERNARGLVGDAQQCFSQAHQRYAFVRKQRVSLKEALHPSARPTAFLRIVRYRRFSGLTNVRLVLCARSSRTLAA